MGRGEGKLLPTIFREWASLNFFCEYSCPAFIKCVYLCYRQTWSVLTVVSLIYRYISRKIFLFEQKVFKAAKPLPVFSPVLGEPQNERFASVKRNVHFALARHVAASPCSLQLSPSPWSDTLHVVQGAQSSAQCQAACNQVNISVVWLCWVTPFSARIQGKVAVPHWPVMGAVGLWAGVLRVLTACW